MVYSSIRELEENYPERDEMSIEEELDYIEDLCDTCEKIGFSEKFHSPYESRNIHNGNRSKYHDAFLIAKTTKSSKTCRCGISDLLTALRLLRGRRKYARNSEKRNPKS